MKNLLLSFFTFLMVHTVYAQTELKFDFVTPIYQLIDGAAGLKLQLEQPFAKRSSFTIGVEINRYVQSSTYLNGDFFKEPVHLESNLWGVGLTPAYRYYFSDTQSKGFFLEAYSKIIFTRQHETDFVLGCTHHENGYAAGAGVATGYKFKLGKWRIESLLGFGKGWSSHEEIFKILGNNIKGIGPDLLIHRLELSLGYALN